MEGIKSIIEVVWGGILGMGWYVVAGIALSALIKTWKLDRRFWVILNKGGGWVVVLAAVAGIFSPLCSCGVLPIVVTLIESGSPLAPAMALLITSPIADPSSIMVNYAALGMGLTVVKVAGALFMGLFAGFLTRWLVQVGWLSDDAFSGRPRRGYCDAKVDPDNPTVVPIDTSPVVGNKVPFFFARAKDSALIIGKFFLIALVVQGVIETYVPVNWVYALGAGDGPMAIFYATMLGLPLPVNGLSAVPVVKGLMHSGAGMGIGPAAAFLMAGPVTSIPAIIALLGMFKRRVFYIYILVGFVGSMVVGYAAQFFLS
ncbi:MAG TPA: permease [Nitrospirota bacterium]